jgi:hypothetical protein
LTGERAVRHSVEVTAKTLFETAAQALAIFKGENPETTHRVTPEQIRRWCDGVAVSSDEVHKRHRVKTLIG